MADLPPGTRLGHFVLGPLLGRGAMGAVYRARDEQLGREVALKFLAVTQDTHTLARFEREASLTAKLSHPHVVGIHGVLTDPYPAIVYELVEGARPLDRLLSELSREQRLDLLEQIASGVAAAHAVGVTHRDLKPDNVLVDAQGRARVSDFGLAREQEAERLTQSGHMVGTPFYMAPEQIRGHVRETGPASDVWALGVILFQLVFERLPFEGTSLTELALQIVSGNVTVPQGAPPALRRLILRCLEARASARPADAGVFLEELRRARRARSPRGLALGLGLGLCVLALAGLTISRRLPRRGPPPPAASPSVSPPPTRAPDTPAPALPAAPAASWDTTVRAPRRIALTSEGVLVLSGKTLVLLDLAEGRELQRYEGECEDLLVGNGGGLLALTPRGEVRAFDPAVGWGALLTRARDPHRIAAGPRARSVAWVAGKRAFVAGPREVSFELPPSRDPVKAVALGRDRVLIGWDNMIGVFSWEGEPIGRIPLISTRHLALRGGRAAAGSTTGNILLFDPVTGHAGELLSLDRGQGNQLSVLQSAHVGSVRGLGFFGSSLLVSGGSHERHGVEVVAWDYATRAARVRLAVPPPADEILGVTALSYDDRRVVLADVDSGLIRSRPWSLAQD